METTLIRLASPATDVIVRCRPAAEILYWGPHLARFRRRMRTACRGRWRTAGWMWTCR